MAEASRRIVAVLPTENPHYHYVYFDDGTVIHFNASDGSVLRHSRIPDDVAGAAARTEARQRAIEEEDADRGEQSQPD